MVSCLALFSSRLRADDSRAEGKRLTKKAAMTVAAYKVWQEVKAWEEEQAEKRRAEEEDEDSEVMMLKERRPKGGRKGEAEVTGETSQDQKVVERGTPGDGEGRGEVDKTENGEKIEVQNERKVQVGDLKVKVEKTENGEKSEVQENERKEQVGEL
jgi:hypothetical protein